MIICVLNRQGTATDATETYKYRIFRKLIFKRLVFLFVIPDRTFPVSVERATAPQNCGHLQAWCSNGRPPVLLP